MANKISNQQSIIIIGATSTIAEHCARQWIKNNPIAFTLVGRDISRLERVANDLKVRSPESVIQVMQAAFLDPADIQATVDKITAQGTIDIVLIAHGYLPQQSDCQQDLSVCREVLDINGLSPVLYAEAFAKRMEQANHGTLVILGSVAGDRGRKSNYAYGAAKGLVTRYAEGLQHRFAGTSVKVVLIKPGPTDTPMTAHLKSKGISLAAPAVVAAQIVAAAASGKPVVYTPKRWRLFMLIIQHLPHFIFHKLNF